VRGGEDIYRRGICPGEQQAPAVGIVAAGIWRLGFVVGRQFSPMLARKEAEIWERRVQIQELERGGAVACEFTIISRVG
jgi:hypothetical protein